MNPVLPEGLVILADKGYASEKNRNLLADKKLKDGISCTRLPGTGRSQPHSALSTG